MKCLLDIRELVFLGKLEMVDPRGCEVSILGDVKNPTEHSPGQPALVGPALSRRAGLDCVQRCLPASTALSSCEPCGSENYFVQAVHKAGLSRAQTGYWHRNPLIQEAADQNNVEMENWTIRGQLGTGKAMVVLCPSVCCYLKAHGQPILLCADPTELVSVCP